MSPVRRAERRRVPVRAALVARPGRLARRLRRWDGPSFRVESAGPVHLHERRAEEETAVRAIEHVEKSVAVRPEHRLGRRAAPVEIGQHGDLDGVVVVGVVRRELEVPLQLSGIRIERHDAVGVEIVARPQIRVPVRTGIPDAPERQVRRRIVGRRHPQRSAAGLPRVAFPGFVAGLAGPGNRVEAPDFLSGARVECRDKTADAVFAAADADEHLVLDDERRHRDRVAELRIPDRRRSTADGPSSRRARRGARRACPCRACRRESRRRDCSSRSTRARPATRCTGTARTRGRSSRRAPARRSAAG